MVCHSKQNYFEAFKNYFPFSFAVKSQKPSYFDEDSDESDYHQKDSRTAPKERPGFTLSLQGKAERQSNAAENLASISHTINSSKFKDDLRSPNRKPNLNSSKNLGIFTPNINMSQYASADKRDQNISRGVDDSNDLYPSLIENNHLTENVHSDARNSVGKIRPHRDITYNPSKEDFEKARRMILKSASKF